MPNDPNEIVTPWRKHDRNSVRVHYGFTTFAGQDPYFSITHDYASPEDLRRNDYGGGAIFGEAEELIIRLFPEVEPLLKWHMFGRRTGPMHYKANAHYWWDIYQGRIENTRYGADPLEAFKSTVIFGALPDDELPDDGVTKAELDEWLTRREIPLHRAFVEDMKQFRLW